MCAAQQKCPVVQGNATCYWKEMWQKLDTMRQHWQLCDISLSTESGDVFRAHSPVLAASSNKLYNRLVENVSSSPGDTHGNSTIKSIGDKHLCILGMSSEVLQITLDFIYGKSPITKDGFEKLKSGADVLGIKAAEGFCQRKIAALKKKEEPTPRDNTTPESTVIPGSSSTESSSMLCEASNRMTPQPEQTKPIDYSVQQIAAIHRNITLPPAHPFINDEEFLAIFSHLLALRSNNPGSGQLTQCPYRQARRNNLFSKPYDQPSASDDRLVFQGQSSRPYHSQGPNRSFIDPQELPRNQQDLQKTHLSFEGQVQELLYQGSGPTQDQTVGHPSQNSYEGQSSERSTPPMQNRQCPFSYYRNLYKSGMGNNRTRSALDGPSRSLQASCTGSSNPYSFPSRTHTPPSALPPPPGGHSRQQAQQGVINSHIPEDTSSRQVFPVVPNGNMEGCGVNRYPRHHLDGLTTCTESRSHVVDRQDGTPEHSSIQSYAPRQYSRTERHRDTYEFGNTTRLSPLRSATWREGHTEMSSTERPATWRDNLPEVSYTDEPATQRNDHPGISSTDRPATWRNNHPNTSSTDRPAPRRDNLPGTSSIEGPTTYTHPRSTSRTEQNLETCSSSIVPEDPHAILHRLFMSSPGMAKTKNSSCGSGITGMNLSSASSNHDIFMKNPHNVTMKNSHDFPDSSPGRVLLKDMQEHNQGTISCGERPQNQITANMEHSASVVSEHSSLQSIKRPSTLMLSLESDTKTSRKIRFEATDIEMNPQENNSKILELIQNTKYRQNVDNFSGETASQDCSVVGYRSGFREKLDALKEATISSYTPKKLREAKGLWNPTLQGFNRQEPGNKMCIVDEEAMKNILTACQTTDNENQKGHSSNGLTRLDTDRQCDKGLERSCDQGLGGPPDQGFGRSCDQGLDRSSDKGFGGPQGQGLGSSCDQGVLKAPDIKKKNPVNSEVVQQNLFDPGVVLPKSHPVIELSFKDLTQSIQCPHLQKIVGTPLVSPGNSADLDGHDVDVYVSPTTPVAKQKLGAKVSETSLKRSETSQTGNELSTDSPPKKAKYVEEKKPDKCTQEKIPLSNNPTILLDAENSKLHNEEPVTISERSKVTEGDVIPDQLDSPHCSQNQSISEMHERMGINVLASNTSGATCPMLIPPQYSSCENSRSPQPSECQQARMPPQELSQTERCPFQSIEVAEQRTKTDHMTQNGDPMALQSDHVTLKSDCTTLNADQVIPLGDHVTLMTDHVTQKVDHVTMNSGHASVNEEQSSESDIDVCTLTDNETGGKETASIPAWMERQQETNTKKANIQNSSLQSMVPEITVAETKEITVSQERGQTDAGTSVNMMWNTTGTSQDPTGCSSPTREVSGDSISAPSTSEDFHTTSVPYSTMTSNPALTSVTSTSFNDLSVDNSAQDSEELQLVNLNKCPFASQIQQGNMDLENVDPSACPFLNQPVSQAMLQSATGAKSDDGKFSPNADKDAGNLEIVTESSESSNQSSSCSPKSYTMAPSHVSDLEVIPSQRNVEVSEPPGVRNQQTNTLTTHNLGLAAPPGSNNQHSEARILGQENCSIDKLTSEDLNTGQSIIVIKPSVSSSIMPSSRNMSKESSSFLATSQSVNGLQNKQPSLSNGGSTDYQSLANESLTPPNMSKLIAGYPVPFSECQTNMPNSGMSEVANQRAMIPTLNDQKVFAMENHLLAANNNLAMDIPFDGHVYRCVVENCEYSHRHQEALCAHLHLKHQMGTPTHTCLYCMKGFFSESQLNGHVRRSHGDGNQVEAECQECGEKFDGSYKLQTHLLKAHGKGKLFSCEECDFKSPRKKDVQAHMLSQHKKAPPGVKIYCCSQCDYKCIDRNRHEEHEAMHSGEAKYRCPQCNKAYTTRRGMRTHLLYHSEQRPHRCDMCDASFKVRSKLRDHTRLIHTHPGVKPFKCGYCDHTTALRGNCNQHIRKHHPDKAILVIDYMANKRRAVKSYDYAGMSGAGIEEVTDVSAAKWTFGQ